jgi:tripartite-type tricarboxylate transporter receptor subunit TctC
MIRRRLLCALVWLFAASTAGAQAFPTKQVRIVIPYPPGGGVDTIGRPLADRLAKMWGQPVIVDNKPGAGTIIGAEAVVTAAPDGHTLLLTTDSTITSNPHLYAKLPFDPQKDLSPVMQLVDVPQLVVVHPSVGATDLKTLVALAREKPNALNYASFGSGSQPHLLFEGLKAQAGINITHVPYKGIAPALTAVVAGEVQMTLGAAGIIRGHIAGGRMRALAIARAERLPAMPEVPTLKELGFADIDPRPWFGIFATGGSPAGVVDRISADIARVLDDPEFAEREIVSKGFGKVASTPRAFAEFIRADLAYKARLIKISGAKAE